MSHAPAHRFAGPGVTAILRPMLFFKQAWKREGCRWIDGLKLTLHQFNIICLSDSSILTAHSL